MWLQRSFYHMSNSPQSKHPSPDSFAEQKFNDDLLVDENDRGRAKEIYGRFNFALNCLDLRERFDLIDKAANTAKRRARRNGIIAIGLALSAWLTVSAEPLYAEFRSLPQSMLLFLSAALGIAGVLVGATGTMHSSKKAAWLRQRFLAERLRQFHFQNMLLRIPELVRAADKPELRAHFQKSTADRLREFDQRYFNHTAAELVLCLERPEGQYEWFATIPEKQDIDSLSDTASEFYRAYRNLRIVHQISYAAYKLGSSTSLWDLRAAFQEKLFSALTAAAVIFGFALNVVQSILIAIGVHGGTDRAIWVAAMWFMIVGLAVRALEEGLQPQREIERYENYKSSCLQKLDQFDSARTHGERFSAMLAVEQASYDEMRLFLRFNMKAGFIM